jgi:hypothetical protein
MWLRGLWLPLATLLLAACGAARTVEVPSPVVTSIATPAATVEVTSTVVAPTSAPTPVTLRLDIRASRLSIPALGIDAPVQPSYVVPDDSAGTPGCPPPTPGGTTLTVPEQGIATPVDNLEGLENKAWLYGHSRWQNQPGLFFRLQDIGVGDEVFVEGVERTSGEAVGRRRFVVDGLYLTDIESGSALVAARSSEQIPSQPLVILQTSAREDGAGKQWLLDRAKVTAKARNIVEGDVNDPCKYLLLFAFARAS